MENIANMIMLLLMASQLTSTFAEDDFRIMAAAPVPYSEQCQDQIIELAPCLDAVQGNGNPPSKECCTGIGDIVTKKPLCLCYIIATGAQNGAFNVTIAFQLPQLCHIQADPKTCQDFPGFPNILPPSAAPTTAPSTTPSKAPSSTPSKAPSSTPSKAPSSTPSAAPSIAPTPTTVPSTAPSIAPTPATVPPSIAPTPTTVPSTAPSVPSTTPSTAPPAAVPTTAPATVPTPTQIPSPVDDATPDTRTPSAAVLNFPTLFPTIFPVLLFLLR